MKMVTTIFIVSRRAFFFYLKDELNQKPLLKQ